LESVSDGSPIRSEQKQEPVIDSQNEAFYYSHPISNRVPAKQSQPMEYFDSELRSDTSAGNPIIWSALASAKEDNRILSNNRFLGDLSENTNPLISFPKGSLVDAPSSSDAFKSLLWPKNGVRSGFYYPSQDSVQDSDMIPTRFQNNRLNSQYIPFGRGYEGDSKTRDFYVPPSETAELIRKEMMSQQQHEHQQEHVKKEIKHDAAGSIKSSFYFPSSSGDKSSSMIRDPVSVVAVSHLRDSDPGGRDTNSAVIALVLGLSITAMLGVLVFCRMSTIKRRISKRGTGGRSLAHDADYLVNGMYL